MPWLIKHNVPEEDKLLLVHVPRCAGTSMVSHFKVEKNSKRGRNLYHRAGLTYFFYRYRLLESANFPWRSYENLYASVIFITGFLVWFLVPDWGIAACEPHRWCPPPLSVSFWTMALFTFFVQTFIATTTMGRVDLLRRAMMWFFGHVMREFSSTIDYLHGISEYGFLLHFTAEKMVRHKFVDREDLRHSFAVVRNPYSRMFSLFMYNRRGPFESFESFVRDWKRKWLVYRRNRTTDEHRVYCHVLPMHEYTHFNNERYVPTILRQEDLKHLAKPDFTSSEVYAQRYQGVPDKVLRAMQGLPRSNGRKSKTQWYDLYNQTTMDLVLDMFLEDFQHFGYSTFIQQRPDLHPKVPLKSATFRAYAPPGSKTTIPKSGLQVVVEDACDDDGRASSCHTASSSSRASRPPELASPEDLDSVRGSTGSESMHEDTSRGSAGDLVDDTVDYDDVELGNPASNAVPSPRPGDSGPSDRADQQPEQPDHQPPQPQAQAQQQSPPATPASSSGRGRAGGARADHLGDAGASDLSLTPA